ncbi:MAG: trypsin-like peptidase domain-containing protein [Planctomycetota bacterium]
MSVKVKCPNCDKYMLVESEDVGTKVKCILCAKPFTARPDWMADAKTPEPKPTKAAEKAPVIPPDTKIRKKAKEDEYLEPDVRWKPTPEKTPEKFVTCPECGKKLPATAHICNRCGWNLLLGKSALARGKSPAAVVFRFAVLACVLILAGMTIGLGVRYFRANWSSKPQPETESPPSTPPSPPVAAKSEPAPSVKKPEPIARPTTAKPIPKPGKPPVALKPAASKPGIEPTPPPPPASLADSVVIVKTRASVGLGFIVDPTTAIVATNRHLVEAGREITVIAFPQGSRQGREFERATLAAVHKKADVALVSFSPRGVKLEAAILAGETGLKKGDKVRTIVRTGADSSQVKEIAGAVADPNHSVSGMSALLTSAGVDAQTTGAPLFDSTGSVVGVNTYSDVWKPSAFALDIRYVRELLEDPKTASLSAEEMDALLKTGIDPLRETAGKGLLGRTPLASPAAKMIADATGLAVFALVPGENSIQVLSQNKVAASIFVGTNPTDFDITPDGKQIYAAVNQPTGISIVDLQKRARDQLVRVEAERAFGVRALSGDRALVICGMIYRPEMNLPGDKEILGGVKIILVNLRTGKVEQEIKNEAPLPVLKSITDQAPKKWTKKNMDTRREWQNRETFAGRLFAFPVIARSKDGKEFYVAGYDQQNSTLKAKDLFAIFKYSALRAVRPEATGPDRIPLHVPTEIKEKTINAKKATGRPETGPPEFAQFPQTMLVSPDGKTALLGAAVIAGENLQLMGTVKRNEAAYAKDPLLCNLQAAQDDFRIAFSGANIFDLKTFTDIAALPVTGTVLTVDSKGEKLYVFNPSDSNMYLFNVRALLAE